MSTHTHDMLRETIQRTLSSIAEIRQGGHEKQYRFHCPRCALPVAYQSTPPPVKSGPFLYVFKGALSLIQGQVPPDAFDDEKLISESNVA